jgi:hypothetical protein
MIPMKKNFHDQEAGMTDSGGNLKAPGDFHPKRHQVCSIHQKRAAIKLISAIYIDTSEKYMTFLESWMMGSS